MRSKTSSTAQKPKNTAVDPVRKIGNHSVMTRLLCIRFLNLRLFRVKSRSRSYWLDDCSVFPPKATALALLGRVLGRFCCCSFENGTISSAVVSSKLEPGTELADCMKLVGGYYADEWLLTVKIMTVFYSKLFIWRPLKSIVCAAHSFFRIIGTSRVSRFQHAVIV